MPRFFKDPFDGVLDGADGAHVARSLRMRPGDPLTVCDGHGTDYRCVITAVDGDRVSLNTLETLPSSSEPSLKVTLYQALPKGDKLEQIIQKSVELGVTAIVPIETAHCVVRIDDRTDKKRTRWQKIADEAAGQSGRGILPKVGAPLKWKPFLQTVSEAKTPVIVFYEGGGEKLTELVDPAMTEVAVVVGAEGGFAPEEIAALVAAGAKTATLGPRILRCETAPAAALAAMMLLSGNM